MTDRRTDGQKKQLIGAPAFTLPKKEHLVSQYIFPVNERIFLVTGNQFPVTIRTKNTRVT